MALFYNRRSQYEGLNLEWENVWTIIYNNLYDQLKKKQKNNNKLKNKTTDIYFWQTVIVNIMQKPDKTNTINCYA